MSALLNRPFVKMNGIGNEIVVLDLRADPVPVTEADARAIARPEAVPFDQLLALYPPKTPGTEAFVKIYNSDGSEAGACGNGMRCIAALAAKKSGKDALAFETTAGLILCAVKDGTITVDMGKPRLALGRDPARRGISRHAHDRAADRADRRADPALALGREHGQPARDLLGR